MRVRLTPEDRSGRPGTSSMVGVQSMGCKLDLQPQAVVLLRLLAARLGRSAPTRVVRPDGGGAAKGPA